MKVGPAFYSGRFYIPDANQVKDTFISFNGWGKGVAHVNDFNIGRYWPVGIVMLPVCSPVAGVASFKVQFLTAPFLLQSSGPQCNLYVPAPILRQGENTVVRAKGLSSWR